MDESKLVNRVTPEYKSAIEGVPFTTNLLELEYHDGPRTVAFQVIDLEVLGEELHRVHCRHGIKHNLETQEILKPLCVRLRHQLGRTSPLEWSILQRFGKQVAPQVGAQYPVYCLGVTYKSVHLPACPGAPKGLLGFEVDLNEPIGEYDTGLKISL